MLAFIICENTDCHLIDKYGDYTIYTVDRVIKVPRRSPTPEAYELLMEELIAQDIKIDTVKHIDNNLRKKC